MSDLPPGEWSPLLVGHQWPGLGSLAVLTSAEANRQLTTKNFETYANLLESAHNGPLAEQEGVTADDARAAFRNGLRLARDIAEKNEINRHAYDSAHRSTEDLRAQLYDVADRGNRAIREIQNSKKTAPEKISEIVDVVAAAQAEANTSAASHSGSVLSAIQQILDSRGSALSAREFARSTAVEKDRAYTSPSLETVRDQVNEVLNNSSAATTGDTQHRTETMSEVGSVPGTQLSGAIEAGTTPPSTTPAAVTTDGESALGSSSFITQAGTSGNTPASGSPIRTGITNSAAVGNTQPSALVDSPGSPPAIAHPTSVSVTGNVGSVGSGGRSADMSNISTPHSPTTNIPTPTSALSPEGLADNFNSGVQAGAPVSTGAEALSNNAVHTAQAPVHSQPVHPAQMAPTAGTPIFETSHAAHTPVDTAVPTPPADAPQTVIAAAPPPAVPTGPAPPAAAPAGPLPAYGADLRPAAAAPAGPPPAPMTAPGSAPVNPTVTALNQPAVVRHQPVATPQNAPSGLTENAVAATAAGAAHTQARYRLQRLLDFVARQEPRLRWAIGDREDGSTILVTDLAGGWVPPHVRIPVGVTLLAPGRRTGSPTTLLSPATLTATYSPGQYITADDAEPVRTSIRARQTADVEELGWELSRATKWRDGLPRLAHTLAKAATSGSGYLDSEIDLLKAHLQAITSRALGEYPDNHDPATVGNWQLLASIGALINNERICANYHLAWFQAMSLTPTGEAQR